MDIILETEELTNCSFIFQSPRLRGWMRLASQVELRYQKRMGNVPIAICDSPVRIRPGAPIKKESIDCCSQYFFLLRTFVLSIGNIEIIQIRLNLILSF